MAALFIVCIFETILNMRVTLISKYNTLVSYFIYSDYYPPFVIHCHFDTCFCLQGLLSHTFVVIKDISCYTGLNFCLWWSSLWAGGSIRMVHSSVLTGFLFRSQVLLERAVGGPGPSSTKSLCVGSDSP